MFSNLSLLPQAIDQVSSDAKSSFRLLTERRGSSSGLWCGVEIVMDGNASCTTRLIMSSSSIAVNWNANVCSCIVFIKDDLLPTLQSLEATFKSQHAWAAQSPGERFRQFSTFRPKTTPGFEGVRNAGVLRANNPTKILIQERFVLHFRIADQGLQVILG